eukprot:TRINITY_DN24188_c0_g4_i1.p1 TRINITY_DN24188_c0_g4~~TRINITY_DN24188_c0_g4_i1.p1  ORF type:complete len:905 (+),score=106.21 TRINITY_DN24188_c0_g4_i1:69-2717(+)
MVFRFILVPLSLSLAALCWLVTETSAVQIIHGVEDSLQAESFLPHTVLFTAQGTNGSKTYSLGPGAASKHPLHIGKGTFLNDKTGKNETSPYPTEQYYEAPFSLGYAVVINIYANFTNGHGGVLLALDTQSPCDSKVYVEVDQARCAMNYPCTLRIPASAVRSTSTKFRTRVLDQDKDGTGNHLIYKKINIDYDSEGVLKTESVGAATPRRKALSFDLSKVVASGGIMVTPFLTGTTKSTNVTMKFKHTTLLNTAPKSASEWQSSGMQILGCRNSYFEVVADLLYPGQVQVVVEVVGDGDEVLSHVQITTRLNWAEGELAVLDHLLDSHAGFFTDSSVFKNGLPVSALERDMDPPTIIWGSPVDWGYALSSVAILSSAGRIPPEVARARIATGIASLQSIQNNPDEFFQGLFYQAYFLEDTTQEEVDLDDIHHTPLLDIPCGDNALLAGSLWLLEGWMIANGFPDDAANCKAVREKIDLSWCVHYRKCEWLGIGSCGFTYDHYWSVGLTFHRDKQKNKNSLYDKTSYSSTNRRFNIYDWTVYGDDGGAVGILSAMTGALNESQWLNYSTQSHRVSPCVSWYGITVKDASFFNSAAKLVVRFLVGFGSMFASDILYDYYLHTVLPASRGYQTLRRKMGVAYMGASDSESQAYPGHPEVVMGSGTYWPPNYEYANRQPSTGGKPKMNTCTWCNGSQADKLADVPPQYSAANGNVVPFVMMASMERSQFHAWMEGIKLLMTDPSGVYHEDFGFEGFAPLESTRSANDFTGGEDGRDAFDTISHSSVVLTVYEGLANMAMRKRLILEEKSLKEQRGSFNSFQNFVPMSNFTYTVPGYGDLLESVIAKSESTRESKSCDPSAYGATHNPNWAPGHWTGSEGELDKEE